MFSRILWNGIQCAGSAKWSTDGNLAIQTDDCVYIFTTPFVNPSSFQENRWIEVKMKSQGTSECVGISNPDVHSSDILNWFTANMTRGIEPRIDFVSIGWGPSLSNTYGSPSSLLYVLLANGSCVIVNTLTNRLQPFTLFQVESATLSLSGLNVAVDVTRCLNAWRGRNFSQNGIVITDKIQCCQFFPGVVANCNRSCFVFYAIASGCNVTIWRINQYIQSAFCKEDNFSQSEGSLVTTEDAQCVATCNTCEACHASETTTKTTKKASDRGACEHMISAISISDNGLGSFTLVFASRQGSIGSITLTSTNMDSFTTKTDNQISPPPLTVSWIYRASHQHVCGSVSRILHKTDANTGHVCTCCAVGSTLVAIGNHSTIDLPNNNNSIAFDSPIIDMNWKSRGSMLWLDVFTISGSAYEVIMRHQDTVSTYELSIQGHCTPPRSSSYCTMGGAVDPLRLIWVSVEAIPGQQGSNREIQLNVFLQKPHCRVVLDLFSPVIDVDPTADIILTRNWICNKEATHRVLDYILHRINENYISIHGVSLSSVSVAVLLSAEYCHSQDLSLPTDSDDESEVAVATAMDIADSNETKQNGSEIERSSRRSSGLLTAIAGNMKSLEIVLILEASLNMMVKSIVGKCISLSGGESSETFLQVLSSKQWLVISPDHKIRSQCTVLKKLAVQMSSTPLRAAIVNAKSDSSIINHVASTTNALALIQSHQEEIKLSLLVELIVSIVEQLKPTMNHEGKVILTNLERRSIQYYVQLLRHSMVHHPALGLNVLTSAKADAELILEHSQTRGVVGELLPECCPICGTVLAFDPSSPLTGTCSDCGSTIDRCCVSLNLVSLDNLTEDGLSEDCVVKCAACSVFAHCRRSTTSGETSTSWPFLRQFFSTVCTFCGCPMHLVAE